LPKYAKWAEFFDWLVSQVLEDGQRIRTYWYVIKMLDFFPYNLPNGPTTVICEGARPLQSPLDK
ncbi:unnamed protein product, partial [marine sediment metagenome]